MHRNTVDSRGAVLRARMLQKTLTKSLSTLATAHVVSASNPQKLADSWRSVSQSLRQIGHTNLLRDIENFAEDNGEVSIQEQVDRVDGDLLWFASLLDRSADQMEGTEDVSKHRTLREEVLKAIDKPAMSSGELTSEVNNCLRLTGDGIGLS